MRYPFTTGVAGVSFRQGTVRQASVGDEVLLRAEPTNPYDPQAIGIYTTEGEHLGYLPAGVATRVHQDEALLCGKITEVLDGGETCGLRVRVHNAANLTDTGVRPGYTAAVGTLVNETVGGETVDAGDAPTPQPWVYSKSGRKLGYEQRIDGRQVVVINADGEEVRYPLAVVERVGAHSN